MAQTKKLRSQYEDLIFKVCAIDYPERWPELVPELVGKLGSMGTFDEMYGTLLTLRRLTENYQFQLDEDREPLEAIVAQTFPLLEGLMQKSLENYTEQTGVLVKVVLKIFHHCMHLQLPLYLQSTDTLDRWVAYLKAILQGQVPPELLTPTLDEQEVTRREKTFYWVNKKWAGRICQRIIQKYCNPALIPEPLKPLSQYIQQTHTQAFIDIFYSILTQTSNPPPSHLFRPLRRTQNHPLRTQVHLLLPQGQIHPEPPRLLPRQTPL